MGQEAIIDILDSVHCRANPRARKLIKNKLKYKKISYKKSRWGPGQVTENTSHLITGRENSSGLFLTGLLNRVKSEKIKITGKENIEKIIPSSRNPKLKNITLRNDQKRAISRARVRQRGTIVCPTGSGKTIIMCGIVSVFQNCRILFLCNTIDLINQASSKFKEFGFKHEVLGDGKKVNWKKIFKKDSCLVLSTIQSFSEIKNKKWNSFFDITLVDEVQYAAKEDSQYGRVMLSNLSPVKLGFTATLPTNDYEKLVVEGFFGPVIYELTNKRGEEIGIIAKAKVEMIPVPYQATLKVRSYSEMYKLGIVENETRNKLIVKKAIKGMKRKKVTLIMVEKINHGLVLQKLFKRKKIPCEFVEGKTDSETRDRIKERLKRSERLVVICTRVWKVGINIPSLNQIILASGMKEEKSIKQAMGRGLRTTNKKKRVRLIDFMDPHRYLAEHSVMRYAIYKKLGWIK